MKAIKMTFFLTFLASLTSCALMDKRDYMDEMAFYQDPFYTPGQDFETIPGDTGRAHRTMKDIMKRTPATIDYDQNIQYQASIKEEMYNLEAKLSEREYEEYTNLKHKLDSDSERIYFLRLRSRSARTQFLQSKGVIHSPIHTINEIQMANYGSDVLVGMDKNSVVSSYGQPDKVQNSGDVYNRTEHWVYHRQDGTHVIEFYRNRVQGWRVD